MASLIVDNLEDDIRERLGQLAQRHGRSVEDEVRVILRSAVDAEAAAPQRLGTWIASHFAKQGLDRDLAELRGYPAKPASFEE